MRFDHRRISRIDSASQRETAMIDQPKLAKMLQRAYSAEKAAAMAYIGHAAAVGNPDDRAVIQQIEQDEWGHRASVSRIMNRHGVPVSRFYEIKFHVIGKIISLSCHLIGWFMPYYFAGRLESGNVCEYFVMMRLFNELDIFEHDDVLYEMGIKEKEHEVYFQKAIEGSRLLPLFEKVFGWGPNRSLNDVALEQKRSVENASKYCRARE